MRWLLVLASGLVVTRELRADAPADRYVIQGVAPNEMVQDTVSGLLWQRTVSAGTYSWTDAQGYCVSLGTGWRVPSLTELQTLVDETRLSPAIDPTAFPATPNAQFWSSSPASDNAGAAWFVFFESGSTGVEPVSTLYRVRCVQ